MTLPCGQKVCLVTGAAQGIGRSIVFNLASAGWAVVAVDNDEEAGNDLLSQQAVKDKPVVFLHADLADADTPEKSIALVQTRFGRLDGLVNNAGFMGTRLKIGQVTRSDWHNVTAVNLDGTFFMTQAAEPLLRKAQGAIVNIASTRAFQSEANTFSYSATKGAVVSLTHALAVSLGPDIRVNCISPGWIETGDWQKPSSACTPQHSDEDRAQHPVGRVGQPNDIAAMVSFLLSPDSGFITGQNLTIDGGMTKKMIYVE